MKFRKTFRNLNAVGFFVWKLESSGVHTSRIRVRPIFDEKGDVTFRVTWSD